MFIHHNHMIKTVSSDWSDYSLRKWILPWTFRWWNNFIYAHVIYSFTENFPVNFIPIAHEMQTFAITLLGCSGHAMADWSESSPAQISKTISKSSTPSFWQEDRYQLLFEGVPEKMAWTARSCYEDSLETARSQKARSRFSNLPQHAHVLGEMLLQT